MKENQFSLTALMASFTRAHHTEHDTPKIFSDPLARHLMTDEEYR
ncbi:MAG: hypothetical protein U0M15_07425 [Bacillota bacterium]|nr:hypothetical protein [Bacillota bacterium]